MDLCLGLAKLVLQAAQHFVLLAFFQQDIVIGEDGKFLLQLALDFVPVAFHLSYIFHIYLINCEGVVPCVKLRIL